MQNDLKKSLEILKSGGVILYPTDTVWGLGCDATDQEAVTKIYRIKNREDKKSMLVLLDTPDKLQNYAFVPEIVWDLVSISNTPLTLIYPEAKNLARGLITEDGTIGIRIVNDSFCSQLIKKFGKPIVSTSANISGFPSPALFNEIPDTIVSQVDYVVKWRQNDTQKRRPSAIIKINKDGTFKIIRK